MRFYAFLLVGLVAVGALAAHYLGTVAMVLAQIAYAALAAAVRRVNGENK